jgi:hypothetical protein
MARAGTSSQLRAHSARRTKSTFFMMKYIDTGCMRASFSPEPMRNGASAFAAMSASAEQSISTFAPTNWRPPLPSMTTPVTAPFSTTGLETKVSNRICTPASTHRRVSSIFMTSGSVGEAIFTPPVLVVAM